MVEVLTTEPTFVPDVYFEQGYGHVDAVTAGGSWVTLANRDGSWQMPLVITELGDGWREAVSPYGYSGIHVANNMEAHNAADHWGSACEYLRDLSVVSLFLRFSPTDPASVACSSAFDGLDVRRSGTTYVVPISELETMWDRLEGRARTAIRKAQRNGLTASVRPASVDDVVSHSNFRRLYEATMTRLGADARYWFDDAYYRGLVTSLGPGLHIAEVSQGDEVVAAALVLAHTDRAHYHLSGSLPAASRLGANSLLVWSMLEWCAAAGIATCHLGGGRTESDGLAMFKRSFGGMPMEFYSGARVVDPIVYTRLTAIRATELGVPLSALESADFFPAFRSGGG